MLFVGPGDGAMACGEFGPGRMSEPLEIVAAVEAALAGDTMIPLPPAQPPVLAGLRVIVTSGPTHEPIDPVRYIANRSSGKQGHAIAQAAADAGASVVLVSGPVTVPDPAGVKTIHVETARQMLEAVEAALPADIFIGAAAVADWRVGAALAEKLKKGASGPPTLGLVENPDILATVASHARRPRLVVGFAAETEKVIDHAQAKLARKKCDLIVANDVSPATGVMGGDANTVHLVSTSGVETWPTLPKAEVARRLIAQLAALMGEGGA
jgi:phosphopantothenoylcysteine decarboxylase/phosphopantothenate--cysteine ligase